MIGQVRWNLGLTAAAKGQLPPIPMTPAMLLPDCQHPRRPVPRLASLSALMLSGTEERKEDLEPHSAQSLLQHQHLMASRLQTTGFCSSRRSLTQPHCLRNDCTSQEEGLGSKTADAVSLKLPLSNVSSSMRNPQEIMNIQFIFTSLLALALSGPGGADWIKPQETEVSAMEGKSVNLLCNYGTSYTGVVDLFWFRQYPNQAPEFILYRGWGYSGKADADFATEKFYSKSTANATTLYIDKLELADTARYHCALRKPR